MFTGVIVIGRVCRHAFIGYLIGVTLFWRRTLIAIIVPIGTVFMFVSSTILAVHACSSGSLQMTKKLAYSPIYSILPIWPFLVRLAFFGPFGLFNSFGLFGLRYRLVVQEIKSFASILRVVNMDTRVVLSIELVLAVRLLRSMMNAIVR